jgi:hypothetical protein
MSQKSLELLREVAHRDAATFCGALRSKGIDLPRPEEKVFFFNTLLPIFAPSEKQVNPDALDSAMIALRNWLDNLEPGAEVAFHAAMAVSKLNPKSRAAVTAVSLFLFGSGYTVPLEKWVKRSIPRLIS